MQKWQIGERTIQFCDECSRNHSGVILMLEARWVETDRARGLRCDACGCTDYELIKFGRFRKFFTFFAILSSRISNRFLRIYTSGTSRLDKAQRRVR